MVKPAQTGEFRPLPDVNENEREKAIRRVADAVHRMNEAIIRAVDQGVSVELVWVTAGTSLDCSISRDYAPTFWRPAMVVRMSQER
jgi:hypothetical protein